MPLNYDLALSKQQFRASPPLLPSSKFNSVKRPTPTHVNLNTSNISNPNLGDISGRGKSSNITGESSRPGGNSYRNPVEPSVPKPQIMPKYRMKMLLVNSAGKSKGGHSQSKLIRPVFNENRQSKHESKKGATRISTNYRSTKSINKHTGMLRGET